MKGGEKGNFEVCRDALCAGARASATDWGTFLGSPKKLATLSSFTLPMFS